MVLLLGMMLAVGAPVAEGDARGVVDGWLASAERGPVHGLSLLGRIRPRSFNFEQHAAKIIAADADANTGQDETRANSPGHAGTPVAIAGAQGNDP